MSGDATFRTAPSGGHLRLRHTGRRAYATAPIEAADGCAVTGCGM